MESLNLSSTFGVTFYLWGGQRLYVWAATGEQRQTGVLLGCIYFYWESEAAVCLQAGWRTDCIYILQLWGPHHKHGRVFNDLQQCHTEGHFIFTTTYKMKTSISSSFIWLHCWPSSVNLKKTNQWKQTDVSSSAIWVRIMTRCPKNLTLAFYVMRLNLSLLDIKRSNQRGRVSFHTCAGIIQQHSTCWTQFCPQIFQEVNVGVHTSSAHISVQTLKHLW